MEAIFKLSRQLTSLRICVPILLSKSFEIVSAMIRYARIEILIAYDRPMYVLLVT